MKRLTFLLLVVFLLGFNYGYSSDYEEKEAQYQKCLDECEQIYERRTSICSLGCFPAVFSVGGEG